MSTNGKIYSASLFVSYNYGGDTGQITVFNGCTEFVDKEELNKLIDEFGEALRNHDLRRKKT